MVVNLPVLIDKSILHYRRLSSEDITERFNSVPYKVHVHTINNYKERTRMQD